MAEAEGHLDSDTGSSATGVPQKHWEKAWKKQGKGELSTKLQSPSLTSAVIDSEPQPADLVEYGRRGASRKETPMPDPLLRRAFVLDAAVSGAAGLLMAAATGLVRPNALGYAFVVGQAAAVAGLAGLQWLGLRRMAAYGSLKNSPAVP
jgi:hypothetical protein